MDKASDFESEDCGFESRRGHFSKQYFNNDNSRDTLPAVCNVSVSSACRFYAILLFYYLKIVYILQYFEYAYEHTLVVMNWVYPS